MGLLVDGKWVQDEYAARNVDGKFVFHHSEFRNWVTEDGSAGPTGSSGFKAESGRYHLYISLACPWACRALMVRNLKKLQDTISLTIVDPLMLQNGWSIAAGTDPINNANFLHEVYTKAKSDCSGRVTVPVLWDKKTNTIVNNESSQIIRMFNSAFNVFGDADIDFYPAALEEEIDEVNDRVFNGFNLGVYKTGFASAQPEYEKAVRLVFETLDWLEVRLNECEYLVGDRLTEADLRLFATLVRFDPVYVVHFKCNLKRIADYPQLSAYTDRLYRMPGVADTVDFDQIKTHYYGSHKHLNPLGIIPAGPEKVW